MTHDARPVFDLMAALRSALAKKAAVQEKQTRTPRLRTAARWGVIMMTPDDAHVFYLDEKHYSEIYSRRQSALLRGRRWKRQFPDNIVRVVSLDPDDRSNDHTEEVPLVRLGRPR